MDSKIKAFTLIELLIVMLIVGVLVSVALPQYKGIMERVEESKVKQDLVVLSEAVWQYRLETGSFPGGPADQLVTSLPIDVTVTPPVNWTYRASNTNDPATYSLCGVCKREIPGVDTRNRYYIFYKTTSPMGVNEGVAMYGQLLEDGWYKYYVLIPPGNGPGEPWE